MPIKTPEDTGWKDYTPVWTAVTTNPALGNGTLVGRFVRIGRTVFVEIKLIPGTTTTFGAGGWRFSAPLRMTGTADLGIAHALDAGTARYTATAVVATATTVLLFQSDVATGTEFASGTPFVWAATDILLILIVYETDEER
ncbi:MAG: hypothetical protein ACRD2A_07405 [Vicinamibacterales bacterium]